MSLPPLPTMNPQRQASPVAFKDVVIPSDPSAARCVEDQIEQLLLTHQASSQDVFRIRLALEEALINAIKHGNKLDTTKKVHVEATVTPEQIEIMIEDEGPGFCRADVPDPTAEENLLKCSGRGILLMETYMDRVEYSNAGRRVRMIKRNTRLARKAE